MQLHDILKQWKPGGDKTCYGFWHVLRYCVSCRIWCCV